MMKSKWFPLASHWQRMLYVQYQFQNIIHHSYFDFDSWQLSSHWFSILLFKTNHSSKVKIIPPRQRLGWNKKLRTFLPCLMSNQWKLFGDFSIGTEPHHCYSSNALTVLWEFSTQSKPFPSPDNTSDVLWTI